MFFGSAVLTALAGGWHCAGMCGPIATLAQSSRAKFLYQVGRLISYLMLAAIAQTLGSRILSAFPERLGPFATLFIGLVGLWILQSSWKLSLPQAIQKFLWKNRPQNGLFSEFFFLGILNGLLPCGWLYGFLILAAGQENPARSLVLLFALWLGSLPWLLSFSYLGKHLKAAAQTNPWMPRLILIAIVFGLLAHTLSQIMGHS